MSPVDCQASTSATGHNLLGAAGLSALEMLANQPVQSVVSLLDCVVVKSCSELKLDHKPNTY